MLIEELFKKYNISTEDIPQSILNIETDNEITYFNKGYKKNGIITFTGEYKPDWIEENKTPVIINITIDLTNFAQKLIQASIELLGDEDPSIEITDKMFSKILTEKAVTIHSVMENNFTSYTAYNILGGIIEEA